MKRLARGVASEERLVVRVRCGRGVWQSICVAQQSGTLGGPTRVFKITRLNALAIAFGKRQHRICEVKGARGYARPNMLIAIHRVDAVIRSILLDSCG